MISFNSGNLAKQKQALKDLTQNTKYII